MPSSYDDELWQLAPADPGPPPQHLMRFVAGLGQVEDALDLGCGDGRLSASLAARSVKLADVSDVALARAAARLPEAQVVRIQPDGPLPLADNAFDLVLCAETLEHVRDVQLLLSEVRRVLRPCGRLAVTTPAHSRLMGLDLLARGPQRVLPALSPHLRHFSRRSLTELLDELGFAGVSVRRRAGTLLAVARR